MADLSTNLAGIRSPNPFWLASAPPTNSGYQVMRAFEAGWGGAVWKTLTDDPVVNVSSRFAGLRFRGQSMAGMNNIELISDRPLEDNLREIREVKRRFPDRAVIASLMIEPKRERWQEVVKRVQDAGVDGFELNFGCPHGMSERGMGSAVGQVPDLVRQNTEWVAEVAEVPVIVKLTPNITDVRHTARAAAQGGANAVSMINTINSLMGVDLDTWNPIPHVDGLGAHGGYCGPAVKPIALHMVADCARDPGVPLPISGIGGVATWQDAAEFLLMGASNVQVCTAVMYQGFRIIEDLVEGLNHYLDARGLASVEDLVGKSVHKYVDWNDLNLSYKVVANIDQDLCIHCNRCYIACEDAAHQCIHPAEDGSGGQQLVVDVNECVGCNLCHMVCPVEGCITMVEVDTGRPPETWRQWQSIHA
ncbi:NAD-dependent dihydropyrimidine dehydrogenase subunit PreA [Alicyclobacillus shizuokensis]|uniref:NAD-dependent dihydropyrimidine dehydrogenase subunit PreA n=1 Tax=Alicyclobacillus shizuokensis TaxID=392014 RepID=UPI00083469EF|nr:NAD-dependent dihydropyrimidine dehydrogenase subunit PreA [Alicyclobacillus shizuokensis]